MTFLLGYMIKIFIEIVLFSKIKVEEIPTSIVTHILTIKLFWSTIIKSDNKHNIEGGNKNCSYSERRTNSG